jgi:SdpC family antimicrobial peptide
VDLEENREVQSLVGKLIGQIEQSKPNFFTQFERRMKSGNPAKVEKAIVSMQEVTLPAMAKVSDVSEEALRTGENIDIRAGAGKCLPAVVVVALAANAVLAGNVAVTVNVGISIMAVIGAVEVMPQASGDDTRLDQEMLADRVAERLDTRRTAP